MHLRNNFASKKAFQITQLALLAGFLLIIPTRLYPHFHPDLIDGLRGFFIAIGVGTLISSGLKNRRH
jgi:hypothetical protein